MRTRTQVGMSIEHRVQARTLKTPSGMELDHLCHNRACCATEHLRLADRRQNGQNLSGAHSDSVTGVRGVTMLRGKYAVRAYANGRSHSGGSHSSIEEADSAARDLRRRLHSPIPEVNRA